MMDESKLINGCQKQNRQAQNELYRIHARTMYGVCLRYASDQDEAKDWLHDGFIKVFSNIQSYKGKGSFEGWMRRVFVNLALENIRKKKSLFIDTKDIQEFPDVADGEDDASDEMYGISQEVLLTMINDLPLGYATVFNLYAIENYSHRDIGQELNISEGTSRSQYARARKLLQDKITQHLKENS